MTLMKYIKHVEKFTVDNSPTILTALGVVGTIGTAVLTHKAATKAERIIESNKPFDYNNGTPPDDFPVKEKVKLVWKLYIPPVVSGTLTIAAIIGANRIGSKRAAAMAAAYTLSEKAYSEYRDKVVEKIGESKEKDLRDDLARDQVRNNPPGESNVVLVGSGEVLCCDLFSGRYFNSSVEELKKAQNDTNFQILHDSYASLTDFYDRIGLPRTDVSEEIGWNQDKMLELEFSTILAEDGRPCVAYRFQVHPIRGYNRLHP
jgi:hypothetical protein